MTDKPDTYTRVTSKIIADLERGELTWHKPGNTAHLDGRVVKPQRHNGQPYQGMNIILLWAAAVERGYGVPIWMTYRQAKELGAHVRKGERAETVVYAGAATGEEDTVTEDGVQTQEIERRFLKSYSVFNVEQIEGLPALYYARPAPVSPDIARDAQPERYVAATQADIRHGGGVKRSMRCSQIISACPISNASATRPATTRFSRMR